MSFFVSFISLGFGRWSNYCFLSLVEDTIFPPLLFLKNDKKKLNDVKASTWRRRADVNMAFYLFLLTALTTIKIYYIKVKGDIAFVISGKIFFCTLGP